MSGTKTVQDLSHFSPKVPIKPYPGLRSFLENEAALFCGRERHSNEVVKRLDRTNFVAVIGGSGSGKSSLIRAGVIPKLRTYGIPEAGDFWLPLVFTPGTNLSDSKHSSISRFSSKFSTLLKPQDSNEANARRIAEISQVFRQERGFERLIKRYTPELLIPSGTDGNKARILVVIDQFEEIFHQSNQGIEDVALLVERIVDHFFDPDPRCFVVLTMRSEHLNDCPAYLELPDVINNSLYLIRRLDDTGEELQKAVVQPAQNFLRILKRQASDPSKLPDEVRFDPKVLGRILADVRNLTADPDHLPLLQHLLARLWETACQRYGKDVKAPSEINWYDLEKAVDVTAIGKNSSITETTNILTASLENWAEWNFNQHNPIEKEQIDTLLRHLALKDPTNGTYTQQRISVETCKHFLGKEFNCNRLKDLLGKTFFDPVSYLYWDDEDPSRVALKVSHESFIRRWSHFRKLIDWEAERADLLIDILEKCLRWKTKKQKDLLLGSADIIRVHEGKIEKVLTDKAILDEWFNGRIKHPDLRERLSKAKPFVLKFFKDSKGKTTRAKVLGNLMFGAIGCLLALFPFFYFHYFILIPANETHEKYRLAAKLTTQVDMSQNGSIPKSDQAVEHFEKAAIRLEEANSENKSIKSELKAYSWIGAPSGAIQKLLSIRYPSEINITHNFRKLLESHFWQIASSSKDSISTFKRSEDFPNCTYKSKSDNQGEDIPIEKNLILIGQNNSYGEPKGLFTTSQFKKRPGNIVLLSARLDTHNKKCEADKILFAIPNDLKPDILITPNLKYLIVKTANKGNILSSITTYYLERDKESTDGKPLYSELFVIFEESEVKKLEEVLWKGKEKISSLEQGAQTGPHISKAAWTFDVLENQGIGIFQFHPEQLERFEPSDGVKLELAAEKSMCYQLGEVYDSDSKSQMYEDKNAEFCIPINKSQIGQNSENHIDWYIGTLSSGYEGWLVKKTPTQKYYSGQPWTLPALMKYVKDQKRIKNLGQ